MNLVYAHNTNPLNATANLGQVISMCKAFIDNGLDLTLLLPSTEINIVQLRKRIRENYDIPNNLEIKYIPAIIDYYRIKKHTSHIFLYKILKEIKPDVFFSRDINFINTAINLRINSIFESHNNRLHLGSDLLNSYLEKKLLRLSKDNSFKLFISISENLSRFWCINGIPKEKILTLHDGFDEFQFAEEKECNECRKRLHLPLNARIVTYTGSLYLNRSIDQILELALLMPEVTFLVVGGPTTERDKLEKKASSLFMKNVIFTGPVSHSIIDEYLFASDVLIGIWSQQVSTIEYCSPLKVFEYMASGKPIVLQQFQTISEVFKDGHNAILVDPLSFTSLLEGVKKALTSNLNIGKVARDEAFKRYTWRNRAKTILDHFA